MNRELIKELLEVTKGINELQLQLTPLYNRQQILLTKLNRGFKHEEG